MKREGGGIRDGERVLEGGGGKMYMVTECERGERREEGEGGGDFNHYISWTMDKRLSNVMK